jgi:hydrogenase maturation factor
VISIEGEALGHMIVHIGFAVSRLDPQEAEEMLHYLEALSMNSAPAKNSPKAR